jgi:hypothetical protein
MTGPLAIICTSIGLGSLLHTLSRWLRNYRNPVKVKQTVTLGGRHYVWFE